MGSKTYMQNERLLSSALVLLHFFVLALKEVFAPEFVHYLVNRDAKFGSIHLGHLLEGESPSVEARAEAYRAIGRVNSHDTHRTAVICIGGNNDVDVFNDTLEGLEQIFGIKLELKKGTVHLVHENNWTNSLCDGLTQDGLSLDANAYKKEEEDII